MEKEDLSELIIPPTVNHCWRVLGRNMISTGGTGLMIGCGSGEETVHLRRLLGSFIVGLDIASKFLPLALRDGNLVIGDARLLPFKDNAFDFVVAIHSLEHMGNPSSALAEVKRVLRSGGWFYVGVPNKNRLVGYLGSYNASVGQIVAWNFTDFLARCRGKFKNELGAHAGFTKEELVTMLKNQFEDTQFLTEEYLHQKYSERIPAPILNLLLSTRVINRVAPSHYALCRKGLG